jgi:hypothetical protein
VAGLVLNLPDVQVPDLKLLEHDLVIATHGRSMWVLDDITPIRELTADVAKAGVHLFTPREAVRRIKDAAFSYHLNRRADSVVIDILDGTGGLVRHFVSRSSDSAATASAAEPQDPRARGLEGPSRALGLNRFSWDLRYPGATVFPGMILWSARPQNGPLAPPGEYQVRISANGETKTARSASPNIPPSPNSPTTTCANSSGSPCKYATRQRANEAVIQIRDLKAQIGDRTTKAADRGLTTDGNRLNASLGSVEEALYQVRNRSNQDPLNFPIRLNNKLAALQRSLETGDMRPSAGVLKVLEELSAELAGQLNRLDRLLETDLAAFNKKLEARRIAPAESKPRKTAA